MVYLVTTFDAESRRTFTLATNNPTFARESLNRLVDTLQPGERICFKSLESAEFGASEGEG